MVVVLRALLSVIASLLVSTTTAVTHLHKASSSFQPLMMVTITLQEWCLFCLPTMTLPTPQPISAPSAPTQPGLQTALPVGLLSVAGC
jgi:hypothetical protein